MKLINSSVQEEGKAEVIEEWDVTAYSSYQLEKQVANKSSCGANQISHAFVIKISSTRQCNSTLSDERYLGRTEYSGVWISSVL